MEFDEPTPIQSACQGFVILHGKVTAQDVADHFDYTLQEAFDLLYSMYFRRMITLQSTEGVGDTIFVPFSKRSTDPS